MNLQYGTEGWEREYEEFVARRVESETEPYLLGTPEWVALYERNIREDPAYREANKGWEGTIALHILAEPAIGLDNDLYLLMDLWHGECRSIRLVPREAGEGADYILTADYDKWKALIFKELNVIKALMRGKIKLKGNMGNIVRYAKGAVILIDLAPEARFQDEMAPEDIEEFRDWINGLRVEYGV
ncbi:MAG: SCP2 sterol-binding domain-containing protein [Actinobacteria bacterium]|nr:SCP2 sterol-binding domain-containing protein [Actinomycetota bacterium]MBU1944924.1 SCP2 sterol-binding domain-containing protein [Actinomycetota bacterium]MBU2688150.1 SCP2 sterol-binding domain-containing protein [Actinomycetota bacterium]